MNREVGLGAEHRIVVDGTFALLLPEHEQLWAFTRTLGSEVLLVVANWSSVTVTLPPRGLPTAAGGVVLLATHADPTAPTLQPWESRVVRLTSPIDPSRRAVGSRLAPPLGR